MLHLSPCRETGMNLYGFISPVLELGLLQMEMKLGHFLFERKEISKLLKQRTLKFSLSFQHIFPLVEKN